jgi:heme-degrading monooxygenase HmoA
MEPEVVWITTRKLKHGAHRDFLRAWKPGEFPEGMVRAYECYAADRNEVVGISVWDSLESRERYRLSETEERRRRAMAPFVVDETSGVYELRELKIPLPVS